MRENRTWCGMIVSSCTRCLGGSWKWRWIPLMLLLAFSLMPVFAPPAHAHAVLVRSDPVERAVLRSAPSQIRLWFTERLNASFSSAYVVNSANQTVVEGRFSHLSPDDPHLLELVVPQALPPAVYIVVWIAASDEDGHTTAGSFRFTVAYQDGSIPTLGSETLSTSPAGSSSGTLDGPTLFSLVMIILVELGAVFWVGASIFQLFVLRPVGRQVPEEEETLVRARRHYQLRLALPLHLVLLLANSGVLLGQAFVLSGGQWTRAFAPSLLFDLITSGSFGRYWLVREVVLLLALRLCVYSVQTRQRPERLDARLPWLHLLLGLAFFVALTMSGHASAAPQNIVVYTLLANWVHLWASAFWIGGMLFLALVLLPTLSGTGLASQVPLLLLTLRTYSPWAIAGVLLMALTGPFAATVRLSGWEQLVTTAYGRVLGIKILLVGGLLLTSAWHVLLLRPRVRQAYQRYLGMSSPQEAEGPPLSELHETGSLLHQEAPVLAHHPKQPERHLRKETHRLLRVLRWEPLLGVGVLICVGFLTVFGGTVGARTSLPSPPITQSATGAFETTVKTTDGKFTLLLTVTPAAVGANEFIVRVQDHRSSEQALGGQLLREGGVSLYLSYTGEMGAKTVNLQPDGKGRFGATEDVLLAGKWSVRIQIRTVERTLHEAKISLQVSP